MIFNNINLRLKLTSLLIITVYLVVASSKKAKTRYGPTGMSYEDSTNCSEFSKFARFNPYSVINEQWFVFYYWAPIRPLTTYIFTVPTAKHIKRLKKVFEGNCVLPVQWDSRLLLMEDDKKFISLLVERDDRGEYWMYPVVKVITLEKITPRDVRLKQTGDNRVLGLMDCLDDTLLVMAKLNDVPRKGKLHETAARLGYRGRKGKSYLYQGHEWGPVGEADEDTYWDRRPEKGLTEKEEESKETKILEGSSEEAESTPTNQSEKPTEDKKTKRKKRTAVGPPDHGDDETCVVAMPELWNDPPPNPNPENLLTVDELKAMDDELETNDTPAIEGPNDSTDKQLSNIHEETTNIPESNKLVNHECVHTMEEPESINQKSQRRCQDSEDIRTENTLEKDRISENTEKTGTKTENDKITENTLQNKNTSENTPENNKKSGNILENNNKSGNILENSNKSENKQENNKKIEVVPERDEKIPEDDKKIENTVGNDNKEKTTLESVKKLENTMENDKISENYKKSENTLTNDNKSENTLEHDEKSENTLKHDNAKQDDENESCTVCYKSQVSYVSDASYIPDSARSKPALKDNEEVPPKEVSRVDVPRFKIYGHDVPFTEQRSTEKLKVPRGRPPPVKIYTKGSVQTLSPEQTNSSEFIILTPKTIDELKSQ